MYVAMRVCISVCCSALPCNVLKCTDLLLFPRQIAILLYTDLPAKRRRRGFASSWQISSWETDRQRENEREKVAITSRCILTFFAALANVIKPEIVTIRARNGPWGKLYFFTSNETKRTETSLSHGSECVENRRKYSTVK